MRHDITKVVVESPREGGKLYRKSAIRKAKRFKIVWDEDGQPDVIDEFSMNGHRWAHPDRVLTGDFKSFTDFLAPLVGFLRKSKGRHWNDVYSEIRRHLSTNSTTHMHIMSHVYQSIETKTYIDEDGDVCTADGPPAKISKYGSTLYVHPVTGIVTEHVGKSYHSRFKASKKAFPFPFYAVTRKHGMVQDKANDVWYWVEYKSIKNPPDAVYDTYRTVTGEVTRFERKTHKDAFGNSFNINNRGAYRWLSPSVHSSGVYGYYGADVYITKRRSANSSEIKRYAPMEESQEAS